MYESSLSHLSTEQVGIIEPIEPSSRLEAFIVQPQVISRSFYVFQCTYSNGERTVFLHEYSFVDKQ